MTGRTILGCISRADFHEPPTSLCCFVLEDRNELTPTDVVHQLREHSKQSPFTLRFSSTIVPYSSLDSALVCASSSSTVEEFYKFVQHLPQLSEQCPCCAGMQSVAQRSRARRFLTRRSEPLRASTRSAKIPREGMATDLLVPSQIEPLAGCLLSGRACHRRETTTPHAVQRRAARWRAFVFPGGSPSHNALKINEHGRNRS